MAKNRTKFVCSNCGAETVRWMGRCPQCGSWNTLEETVEEVLPKQLRTTHEVVSGKRPQKLSEVNLENHERMQLVMPEVDRPLGGGVVCFHHFGWDLPALLTGAGFSSAHLRYVRDPARGLPHGIWVLVARR